MIEAVGLRKSFVQPRSVGALLRRDPAPIVKVLDGVDLTLGAGEIIAIEGANGTGKSTLLRLAAGLLLPDGGQITVAGLCPQRERQAAAARFNYLPGDDRGLPHRATVRQTLALFAALRGLEAHAADAQVARNLSTFELAMLADRRVAELSTGQRRRLQLGAALLGNVSLLLLDEPTRGLDRESQARFWEHLVAVRRAGAAILLATHSDEERQALSATALRLVAGKLVPGAGGPA